MAKETNILNLPDRIYCQYANKSKLKQWMNITRSLAFGIAEGADQVKESLNINTAKGESLKIISRIVVVNTIKKEELMNAAQFAKPDGTQFGDDQNSFAHWSTFTDMELNDELLRTACRAKIIKNSIVPTIENLLSAFDFVFPDAKVDRLINHHDMSFSIEYGGLLSPLESLMIEVNEFLPLPQGVRLRGFIRSYGIIEFLNNDTDSTFGDEDLEFLQ